jgi:hypothetical protein
VNATRGFNYHEYRTTDTLPWKTDWNEIILIVDKSRVKARKLVYLNGQRHRMKLVGALKHSTFWQSRPLRRRSFLGRTHTEDPGQNNFVGWIAKVIVIPSILKKEDISKLRSKLT